MWNTKGFANAAWAAILVFSASLGCGGMGEDSAKEGAGMDNAADSSSASDTYLEPEEELELDLKPPQASEHYVYVAVTKRDSLVRIDAESLEIVVIPVGSRPTQVATLPVGDVALVINEGTQDLSIVRSSPDSDKVKTVDTLPYVNRIAVSPAGNYAVVYYDDSAREGNQQIGNLQTVNIIKLVEGQESVAAVSTGFHPTRVYFNQSKPIAYLVTDDGISVIPMDTAKTGYITNIIPVSDSLFEDPSTREVLVTPDGSYAVVRNTTLKKLSVVDLKSGKLKSVELPGLPTDIDLVPERNEVLVMLREEGVAVVASLEAVLSGDEGALISVDIKGTGAGAAVVSADGNEAVFYTTVGGHKSVGLMDLVSQGYPWTAVQVQKAVVGVSVSPVGTAAVIYHEKEAPDKNDNQFEQTVAKENGFTVFDLESKYRKLFQTRNRWSSSMFVSEKDGKDFKVYVLAPDPSGAEHRVYEVDLDTYLAREIPLTGSPTSMVYVPLSRKVAVAQEHLTGRITFLDVDSGDAYSVTGYELNGLIH